MVISNKVFGEIKFRTGGSLFCNLSTGDMHFSQGELTGDL
jgi:hypothetical protein